MVENMLARIQSYQAPTNSTTPTDDDEWEYYEEDDIKDLTPEDLEAMTPRQRQELVAKSFHYDMMYVKPKMMMATDNFLPSEIQALENS